MKLIAEQKHIKMYSYFFILLLTPFCVVSYEFFRHMHSNQPKRLHMSAVMTPQLVSTLQFTKEQIITQILATNNNPQTLTSSLWQYIKEEGKEMSKDDFRSSAFIASTLLMENSLEEAIIDFIANQLDTTLIPATQIRNIFSDILIQNQSISHVWTLDLLASCLHDESIQKFASVILFNKGYHALVAYRIANSLWYSGRDSLARYFQSLISRKFSSDLHPACSIGPGCYFAAGSDMVIGETASVGRDCCLHHGVTLGGTGKEAGDRHPKVGDFVMLGAGSTILGNIVIGEGSIINAGSVVTKVVEPYTRVGGIPAKLIGAVNRSPVASLTDLAPKRTYSHLHYDTDSALFM